MKNLDAADGYTVERYFTLVEDGLISPDDHVELLDGLIVAAPPQAPYHAATISRIERLLREALAGRALVRTQMPLIAATKCAPEPDLCVVAGSESDYIRHHPFAAMLVVEVSESSLAADRLTKSRIYAGASVTNYWIVNLRDNVVEWYARPDAATRVYAETGIASGATAVRLDAFPDVALKARDLILLR